MDVDKLCVVGDDGRQEEDPGVQGPSEADRMEENNPSLAASDIIRNGNPKTMFSEYTTPCSMFVSLTPNPIHTCEIENIQGGGEVSVGQGGQGDRVHGGDGQRDQP